MSTSEVFVFDFCVGILVVILSCKRVSIWFLAWLSCCPYSFLVEGSRFFMSEKSWFKIPFLPIYLILIFSISTAVLVWLMSAVAWFKI